MRRIVLYPSSTHYSEIKISPQWHQWLRHTRSDPPSLTEQSQDLVRQQNLKVLAAEADAKWAAKPSYLDAPARQREQPIPALEVKDPRGYSESIEPENLPVSGSAAVGCRLGPKLRETETTVEQATRNEEYPGEAKVLDELRHHFNEQPDQKNSPREKQEPSKVEDPWKQARGGPEEWQPKGWDGTIKAPRR
jgi:NADH dehydrogenase [ubiquinone] 1 alpha subcomplex assembly factor 2